MCTLVLFYSFVNTPAEYACFPRVYTMRADGILHRDVYSMALLEDGART